MKTASLVCQDVSARFRCICRCGKSLTEKRTSWFLNHAKAWCANIVLIQKNVFTTLINVRVADKSIGRYCLQSGAMMDSEWKISTADEKKRLWMDDWTLASTLRSKIRADVYTMLTVNGAPTSRCCCSCCWWHMRRLLEITVGARFPSLSLLFPSLPSLFPSIFSLLPSPVPASTPVPFLSCYPSSRLLPFLGHLPCPYPYPLNPARGPGEAL